jgi:hypothetical protein
MSAIKSIEERESTVAKELGYSFVNRQEELSYQEMGQEIRQFWCEFVVCMNYQEFKSLVVYYRAERELEMNHVY